MTPFEPLRARLRQEEGVSLVETLVATLAVSMLAVGVFTGVDAASHVSGTSKHRAVAATLAQEDQERMRAVPIAELANNTTQTTRTVDGVPYTVRSEAIFVEDAQGTTSCASPDSRADYVSVVSEVSWPGRARGQVAPVRLDSILTPPTGSFSASQGSVAVQLRDRAGAPVPGATLALDGAASYRQATNAMGCGMFAYIQPGTYGLAASAPGWVDRDGNDAATTDVSVSAGTTRVAALELDRAATADVRFETRRPGAAQSEPTAAEAISVAHSALAAPGYRVFPEGAEDADDPEPHEQITAGGLFPFTSPYGVFSGACPGNDPALYNGIKATVNAQPGTRAEVVVFEPALDVRVASGATPLANARVVITGITPGCSQRWVHALLSDGTLADPGLPYGFYTVCVSAAGRKVLSGDVDLSSGSLRIDMPNPSSGLVGSC